MEQFQALYLSPLGNLILVSNRQHLIEIQITDDKHCEVSQTIPTPLQKTINWLDDYFSGKKPSLDSLPLHLQGTAFQKEVWSYLPQIPYGQTVTYGEIAANIAKKRKIKRMSAQAVGQAVGANPIPIIIPCHRVVGANGTPGGYACGLDRKLWLLRFESKNKTKSCG